MGFASWANKKRKKLVKKTKSVGRSVGKVADKVTDVAKDVTGKAKELAKDLDNSALGDVIDMAGTAYGIQDVTGKISKAASSLDGQVRMLDSLVDVAIGDLTLNNFKNQAIQFALQQALKGV